MSESTAENVTEIPIESTENGEHIQKRKLTEVDSIEEEGPEAKRQKIDDQPAQRQVLYKRENADAPKYLPPLPVANVKKPILLGSHANNSKKSNDDVNNHNNIHENISGQKENIQSSLEQKSNISEDSISNTNSLQHEDQQKIPQNDQHNIKNEDTIVNTKEHVENKSDQHKENSAPTQNQQKPEVTQDSNEDIVKYLSMPIFPTSSVDSITKIIGDFIFKYGDRPNVEIEAKFGFVIDKQSNQRIRLPSTIVTFANGSTVMNEACVNPQVARFESYVHLDIFKSFNSLMNNKFTETKKSTYKGPRMQYQVQKETDQFDFSKNRKTVNDKGELIRCIKKTRLDNLDVYCPNNILDFRISATIEEKVPDLTSAVQYEREKHRISYAYSLWQFDVTSVKTNEKNAPKNARGFRKEFQKSSGSMLDQVNYEIEVECRNMPFVLEQRDKVFKKQPNQFSATVQSLVSNLRAVNSMLGMK